MRVSCLRGLLFATPFFSLLAQTPQLEMILRLVNDPLKGGSDIAFDINKDGTIESTYF